MSDSKHHTSTDAMAIGLLALFDKLAKSLIQKGVLSQAEFSQILNDAIRDLRESKNEHAQAVETMFRHLYEKKSGGPI